jgi:hypothetical protein
MEKWNQSDQMDAWYGEAYNNHQGRSEIKQQDGKTQFVE